MSAGDARAEPGGLLDRAHLAGQQSGPLRLSRARTGMRRIRTTGRTRRRCSSGRPRRRGCSSPRSIAVATGWRRPARAKWQGRKFFYFGSAAGGQNWMDYLSRPGEGKYLEIQSGIAPTQNQRFELQPGEELRVDRGVCAGAARSGQGARCRLPRGGVRTRRALLIPGDELAAMDAFLREQARLPLERQLLIGRAMGGAAGAPARPDAGGRPRFHDRGAGPTTGTTLPPVLSSPKRTSATSPMASPCRSRGLIASPRAPKREA